MKKMLLVLLGLALYGWVLFSGRDKLLLEHGKIVYNAVTAWLEEEEEIHFQLKNTPEKKRLRRWD